MCMHAKVFDNMLISNNSYNDVNVKEYMNRKRIYELNTCMKAIIKRMKLYLKMWVCISTNTR